MTARWLDPQPVKVPDALRRVAAADGGAFDVLVAEMLVRRGIVDPEIARAFLDPAAYTPASPEALPGLAVVVDRLERAIASQERLVVWGDFDVDGQTATALYVQALGDLGARVSFHIPTRRQSHGLHPVGVQRLIDEGAQLLLTADTGVDAHAAVDLAVAQGVDVLVTDHHDLGERLPDALAVVNPKRLPADHPLYELPGVGVAYQVVRSLCGRAGQEDTSRFLDLVALGIVADVATLRGDVRYLLQRGLDVLRRTERLGLSAVFELARLNPASLGEEDIGFTLAPRLNALSRVGGEWGADQGVELLTTGDRTRARTIATALEALNARRRWLTRQTTEAALAQLDRDRSLLDGPAIVVSSPTWDPGIVGIVAGRLAERFIKPAIVLSAPEGEMARGSARSVKGIDIHAAIAAQREMLYRCGGHPMAAGLSLEGERIPEFRRALWRTLARAAVRPAEREIPIDTYLPLDQISLDLVKAVDRLSPFGPGNERPVFASRELELASSAVIGRTREHRRVVVRDAHGHEQSVMWWQGADQPQPEGRFDLAYTLGINAFRGEQQVQVTWADARQLAPPPLQVAPEPTVRIRDYRVLDGPVPVLRSLWRQALEKGEQWIVWGEGASPVDGIPFCNRSGLHEAETLVIWTIPPGPAQLYDALVKVSPACVILFAVDPAMDDPPAFLRRLAGLVRYALRARGGQVSLASLAAYMAHGKPAVRLGLAWMEQRGQVEVLSQGADRVTLRAGDGTVGDGLDTVRAQLLAQLEETAAYRSYYVRADANRLVAR